MSVRTDRTSDPRPSWTAPRAGPVSTPTTRRDRRSRPGRRRRRIVRRRRAGGDRAARTGGGGRWPTSTTSASGRPASWSEERAAERARVAAAFLPVLDTSTWRWRTPRPTRTPSWQGVRAVRDQALDVLSGLGYPRAGRRRCPVRPAPPRGRRGRQPGGGRAARRRGGRRAAAGLRRTPNGSCGPRPSPWPTAVGA